MFHASMLQSTRGACSALKVLGCSFGVRLYVLLSLATQLLVVSRLQRCLVSLLLLHPLLDLTAEKHDGLALSLQPLKYFCVKSSVPTVSAGFLRPCRILLHTLLQKGSELHGSFNTLHSEKAFFHETDRRAASRDACLSVGFSIRFLLSTCSIAKCQAIFHKPIFQLATCEAQH